jgi:hypothetical protein
MTIPLLLFLFFPFISSKAFAQSAGDSTVQETLQQCLGPASSSLSGKWCSSGCGLNCVCDLTPSCNSCKQLLAGCSASAVKKNDVALLTAFSHLGDYFPLQLQSSYLVKGVNYTGWNVSSLENASKILTDVCVEPELPRGLTVKRSSDSYWTLSGVPDEVVPYRNYTIIAKAPGYVGSAHIAFSVIGQCPSLFTVSNNGSCGGSLICREGDCCSRWGYCGNGELFCGHGCKGGNCTTGD